MHRSHSRGNASFSTMSSRELTDRFGTAAKPKNWSGKADNGDSVHSIATSYCRESGLIDLVANGKTIKASPADIEILVAGIGTEPTDDIDKVASRGRS